jgi:RNA polymerase sigma-70 factor (ECF subfamily)
MVQRQRYPTQLAQETGPFPPSPGVNGLGFSFSQCRTDDEGEPSDAQVVQAVLRGDQSKFSLIVRRYQRPVFALLMRMVARPEDAEDLAQETFLKVYRALGQWDRRRSFRPWLYQIARNTALSALRRDAASVISIEELTDQEPERLSDPRVDGTAIRGCLIREQCLDMLHRTVSELSSEDASLYQMRYTDGMSMKEIAQATNEKEGTIAVRVHRLREKLCARLKKEG